VAHLGFDRCSARAGDRLRCRARIRRGKGGGCAIETRTTIVDGLAQIDDAEPSFWSGMFPAGNKTLGGWSLRARRNGAMLVVSERTDKDKSPTDEQLRPYCGGSAPLEGRYFPAR
jgi:hypothetical protein